MAPLESDGVEIVDLSDMPPLEDDEEEVKSGLKETIAERAKLNPRKKNRNRNQNFDTKQTSTIISTNKSNSYKLKNKFRQTLYQYSKITKKVSNKLIKSL